MIKIQNAIICKKCGSIYSDEILRTTHQERYANKTYTTELGPPHCRFCDGKVEDLIPLIDIIKLIIGK